MGTIDVKSPPAKPTAAESSATEATSGTTKPATPKPPALLASVVKALLHFVSTHRIKRVGRIPRNCYGFRRGVRRNPGNWHARRRNLTHRTVGCILPSRTLKYRKTLEAAPGRAGLPLPVAILLRPRQQNQFKIRLHIWMGRVRKHFLAARGKCRHFHPHRITSLCRDHQ